MIMADHELGSAGALYGEPSGHKQSGEADCLTNGEAVSHISFSSSHQQLEDSAASLMAPDLISYIWFSQRCQQVWQVGQVQRPPTNPILCKDLCSFPNLHTCHKRVIPTVADSADYLGVSSRHAWQAS